jgi:hypothetical protein
MIIVSGKQFKLRADLTAFEVAGRKASPATIPAGAVIRMISEETAHKESDPASHESNGIEVEEVPLLGLWGSSNLNRVAVSLESNAPETVLGYVREVGDFKWAAEGDSEQRRFNTPREAAEHGYAILWRSAKTPHPARPGDPEEVRIRRAAARPYRC